MMPSRDGHAAGATVKWLSIVGIGEDGLDGLSEAARGAIADAETVFGGARHLKLAAPAIRGEARQWSTPFDATMDDVVALRGRKVCVLASGDPFCHGVGATLARRVEPCEFCVLPAPSAFSLAAARLGWALQEVETLSLHGRSLSLLGPLLHERVRILALTSNGAAPAEIANFLTERGFGASRLYVLEALGGNEESITVLDAEAVQGRSFGDLNIVAIDVTASGDPSFVPLAGALNDDLFDHDGQITKREIRAITLSSLAPRRGELLWDVGAGSGSVAISWMLAHPSLKAIAIERDADRAARIGHNADKLGVPSLALVEGSAPDALAGLPRPDAVFVGGGGSRPGTLEAVIDALPARGRLVANAVTLEMESVLLGFHDRLGGNLTRLAITRSDPVGTMTAWRPAMPVTQWVWSKP